MTSCHCSGFMRIMRVSRVMPAAAVSVLLVPKVSNFAFVMGIAQRGARQQPSA